MEKAEEEMNAPSSQGLPFWRKLGYAVGGCGDSLAFSVGSYDLMYYLINVAGVPPLDVGVKAGLPRVLFAPLGLSPVRSRTVCTPREVVDGSW